MGVKLNVDIDGNSAGFAAALNKAKADAKTFAADVSGGVFKNFNTGFAGAVSNFKLGLVAAIVGIPALIGSKLGEIQERAKSIRIGTIRTGLTSDEFQRVANVTSATGSDPHAAATAIDHIAKAQSEIRNGSIDSTRQTDKLASAFANLGVSLSEIERLSPQQLFFRIASAMQEASAAGKLTADQITAIREILGKGGMELVPAFAKGFEGSVKDAANLTDEEVERLAKSAKKLDGVKAVWSEFGNVIGRIGGVGTGFLAWFSNSMPGGKLSGETGITLTPEAIAGRERLAERKQQDRSAQAEEADRRNADRKFAEEAKKLEEQIASERLKSGTPEEQRAALLDSIRQHEQEIADIRMYQEAGAFSETEARLRMDREELAIIKEQNALKQAERSEANKDADHWKRIGMIDRIQSSSATKPVQQNDGTSAINRHIDFIESHIAAGDAAMNAGNMGEEQVQQWLRQREVLRARQSAAERSISRKTQSSERGFGIGGIDIAREQDVSNVPQEGSPEFIGPQAEDFNTVFERMIQEQRWRELVPSLMTSPLGNPGGTALVPAQPDSESTRRTLTLLEQSNNAQREMQVSLRRLENALA